MAFNRRPPKLDLVPVVEDDPPWVKLLMGGSEFDYPKKCSFASCGEMFERRSGAKTDLPKCENLLFCSALCAYRYKKAELKKRGIVLR